MPAKYTAAERERAFWSKVAVSEPDECWPWTGGTSSDGYGRFWVEGHRRQATAVAWTYQRGPIAEGLCVLHSCDNPPCCNVFHLFLGTKAINAADMVAKGRHPRVSGASHGSRTRPDRLARGVRHGSVTHPERVARGERVASARLTAAQVLEIRRRLAAGERGVDLAAAFGVKKSVVSKIARRATWSHLITQEGE